MRVWMMAVATVAAGATLAGSASSQSLAEIAARTAKKREEEKAKKPSAKVYTDTDLRAGAGGSGAVSQMETDAQAPAAPAGAVPPAGEKAMTEEQERALKQAEWGDKLEQAQANVARFTEDVSRAQTALNDISGPLYGGTRAGLLTRLEESKKQLATWQKTLEDLQEEGRRKNYR